MQQTHRKKSSVIKTKQKLKKVSHETEDFPSPITMVLILKHTHTHTDTGMHATHICSMAYERTLPHTSTHTCLACFSFIHALAFPLFIHGDPGADTISFYLNYISQLPYNLWFFSCPYSCTCVPLFCILPAVTWIVSNKCNMDIHQRCQELFHMQRELKVNKD